MHQPATTNPLIIMCINMTIVFAVLIGLSFMIKFIHMIDPTKPKEKPAEAPKAAPAAAPAAAAPAAPAVDQNPMAVKRRSLLSARLKVRAGRASVARTASRTRSFKEELSA